MYAFGDTLGSSERVEEVSLDLMVGEKRGSLTRGLNGQKPSRIGRRGRPVCMCYVPLW